ncbi:MAG: ATP-grasp domain-containing protein [Candidatus Andersenbacteria bacterium]
MKFIEFDWGPGRRVIGVTQNAFDRLGLSDHLPHYEIITGTDDTWHDYLRTKGVSVTPCGMDRAVNVSDLLEGVCVRDYVVQLKNEGITPLFLITNITGKVQSLAEKLGVPLLANPVSFRRLFENKAGVREIDSLQALFPRFDIQHRSQLLEPERFEQLASKFSLPFVVQNESEQLSGSRGTAIIRSHQDYETFFKHMHGRGGDRFVVSEYIAGQPYSVQGCITASGIYWGPIQRQIVSDLWLSLPGFSQFCGGVWGEAGLDEAAFYAIANQIGAAMKQQGYKGIFGIDFLLSEDGKPYAIEVNARLTSMTPVLSMMQNKQGIPPLLLLHVLEHARVPYALHNQEEYRQKVQQSLPLSYVVLHNRRPYSVRNAGSFRSGIYTFEDGSLQYIRPGYILSDIRSESEILIPDVPDHSISTGRMLVRAVVPYHIWSLSQGLLPQYEKLIEAIESYFEKVT